MLTIRTDIISELQIAIDELAFKVIIEEAGGTITDIKGQSINKETNTIIATNSKLHEEVSNIFK